MTAVEWFNQQLVDRQNGNGDSRSRDEIFEQAKEMEKERKIEFACKVAEVSAEKYIQGKTTEQIAEELIKQQ